MQVNKDSYIESTILIYYIKIYDISYYSFDSW